MTNKKRQLLLLLLKLQTLYCILFMCVGDEKNQRSAEIIISWCEQCVFYLWEAEQQQQAEGSINWLSLLLLFELKSRARGRKVCQVLSARRVEATNKLFSTFLWLTSDCQLIFAVFSTSTRKKEVLVIIILSLLFSPENFSQDRG